MATDTSYRGLTIRIGGDVTKLTKALTTANRAITATQGQLKRLNQATKLDPGNTGEMASRLDLVRRKALEVASRMAVLSDAVRQVGDSKSGGNSIKDLARRTEDAALDASKARDRYNELNSSLATFYKLAKKNAGIDLKADENLGNTDAWVRATDTLRKQLDAGKFGDDTEQIRKLVENAQRFKSVWAEVSANLKEKNTVAQFVDLNSELQRSEAEVSALSREMAELRLNDSAPIMVKALDRELDELGASADVASGYMRHLDDALKLDPGNTDLINRKIALLGSQSEITEKQVSTLEAKMRALGTDARDLANSRGVVRLAEDAAKAEKSFVEANDKVTKLKGQLANAEKELEKIAQESGRMGPEYDEARNVVRRFQGDLGKAEKEAEELYEEAVKFKNANAYAQTSVQAAELKAQLAAAKNEAKALNEASKLTTSDYLEIATRLSSVITPALRRLGSYSIRQAETVDSAFRDMAKTVNATDEELEALREHAQEFSTTHFTSADQMLEIMAMGGQLGIAAENLEAFGDVASSLEIATNMGSASEIAQTLGQMAAIMDDLQDESGQLDVDALTGYADAITRLGNNMPALESDISNISQRLASQANILGFTTPQVLAWSTALAATGQKSEAAGTALAKTFTMIELAVGSATGDMQEYADMVGMSVDEFMAALQEAPEQFSDLAEEMGVETDELASSILDAGGKLEGFAEIAGMTADQFAAMWANDPSGAMQAFIEGLAKIDEEGGSVDAVLDELGIKSVRQKQAIEGLSQTVDILGDALVMSQDAWDGVSDQWGDAGDAAREADRKAQGFSGTLQELKNTAQVLGSEVGESLLPFLRSALDVLKDVYNWYSGLSDSQQTSATIFGGVIAAAPLATAAVLKFVESAKDASSWQGKLAKKLAGGMGTLVDKFGAANLAAGGFAAVGLAVLIAAEKEAYDNLSRLNYVMRNIPSAMNKVRHPVEVTGEALGEMAEEAWHAADSYRGYLDSLESHTQTIEGVARSFEEQWQGLSIAEEYLRRYAGQSGLTAEEQGKLQWAVDQVNEACGTEWQVIDAANGKIEDQAGVVVDATDAINDYIAAKKQQIQLNAYEEILTELYQERAETLQELSEQQDYLNQLQSAATSPEGSLYGGDAVAIAGQMETVQGLTDAYDSLNDQINIYETEMGELASLDPSSFTEFSVWARDMATALGDIDPTTLQRLATEMENLGVHFDTLSGLSTDAIRDIVNRWSSGEEDLRTILAEYDILYEDAGMGITRSMGKSAENTVKAYTGKMATLPSQVATETRKVKTKLEEGLNQERNASTWAARTMSAYKSSLNTSIDVSGVTSKLRQLDMSGQSYTWGTHLIENLAAGIEARINKLSGASARAAKSISNKLGQTVAKEGPLHYTDVWGVHLMDNIINGIESRQGALERASLASAEIIADSMDVESRLAVPTMSDAPVTSLQGVVQGGNTVYIDGARINDTPAIQEATKVYLMDMARLGAM
ncbi:MAG: phage tail tape measure protein [Atopobiaceae bacterium]|nr:phage tail tape measure protein [Atopobiaceae bacterium]